MSISPISSTSDPIQTALLNGASLGATMSMQASQAASDFQSLLASAQTGVQSTSQKAGSQTESATPQIHGSKGHHHHHSHPKSNDADSDDTIKPPATTAPGNENANDPRAPIDIASLMQLS